METRVARCLLLSKVLIADGIMTENERNFLEAAMDKLALTDDERKRVVELEGWNEAESALVALSLEKKQELVSELIDAATTDGRLSPLEAGMVQRISDALGIPR